MKRLILMASLALTMVACGMQPPEKDATQQELLKTGVDQGPQWFRNTRAQFYSQDQGSRLMPLRWLAALKQADGTPFLADGLSRYGYLRNNENPLTLLPAGFTTNGPTGNESVGMNCAACHTREIQVDGKSYRIDGGPAIADFQSFLSDLDKAFVRVAKTPQTFKEFTAAVLERDPSPAEIALLKKDVKTWYLPFHTIVDLSLPKSPWGPSRLDAVSMIFNRLTGLDIGPAWRVHMIWQNIKRADAPTRYPFLWNASIQDETQWPGFAGNGNDLLALARNTGEVLGVFGEFTPTVDRNRALGIDYTTNNSANTEGLWALENLIRKIGPPKFQWPVDAALAKQGEAIFNWPNAQGGCVECHGIKTGTDKLSGRTVWTTPIQDVGTDSREYRVLTSTVETGVLAGHGIPVIGAPLKQRDFAFSVLGQAVTGTILQRLGTVAKLGMAPDDGSRPGALATSTTHKTADSLATAFQAASSADNTPRYESRVLQGIWAAAPYLHNGSVPTLADLLKPVKDRPTSFQIGPNYDPNGKVGLAQDQTKFPNFTLRTGCTNRDSGNSNCGHEFGTQLTDDQKKALLEYLKTL